MNLHDQINQHPLFGTIAARATFTNSSGFLDLFGWYPSEKWAAWHERLLLGREFGVCLETPCRKVVIEEHDGEIRFYAGRFGHEVEDQPEECGVFSSIGDAMFYAEAYLVHGLHPREIVLGRKIRYVNGE